MLVSVRLTVVIDGFGHEHNSAFVGTFFLYAALTAESFIVQNGPNIGFLVACHHVMYNVHLSDMPLGELLNILSQKLGFYIANKSTFGSEFKFKLLHWRSFYFNFISD